MTARFVHKRPRFSHDDGTIPQSAGDDLGTRALMHFERCTYARGQQIGHHEPDVVPGLGVLRTGVAQTDDQLRAPPAWQGWIGHLRDG